MAAELENMIGEELLLLAVLGGKDDRAAIDRELDRRALSGPPSMKARRMALRSRRHTFGAAA